jgi:hypothetical protein
VNTALRDREFDLLASNQWARRVVHGDIFRVAIDSIQASANGILPTFAARDNRPDLSESRAGSDFLEFIMPLFARNNDDFAYGLRAFERADCMSNHGFVSNCDEQFIEAHSLAAAAGYDDGTEHNVEG